MASRLATPLLRSSRVILAKQQVSIGIQTYRGCLSRAPVIGGRRQFSVWRNLLEKKYTQAHEWIELSSDGKIGTIGISTYAAKSLGDVVYVELPTADLEINSGDAIGAVESVKSASDIYAPIGGKVVESNALLEEKPGTINKSPEEEGWIAKIEIKQGEEKVLDDLMGAEEYGKFVEEAED